MKTLSTIALIASMTVATSASAFWGNNGSNNGAGNGFANNNFANNGSATTYGNGSNTSKGNGAAKSKGDASGEGSFSMSFSFKGKGAGKGDFDGKSDMVSDQKVAGNGYATNDMNNSFNGKTASTTSQAPTYYAAPVAPAKKAVVAK